MLKGDRAFDSREYASNAITVDERVTKVFGWRCESGMIDDGVLPM